MLMDQAEGTLLSMLAESGVLPGRVAALDVATLVEVYRRFASISADDVLGPDEDGDGVLAQFGTFDFRGATEFSADFTRQFQRVDDGDDEDSTMWQLRCTVYWGGTPANQRLGSGELWSFGSDLDGFFREALALPGWAWALSGEATPCELEVSFEQV